MSPSLIQKSQGPCSVMTTGNVAKAGPLARLCRPNPESAFTKACLGFVNLFLSLSKLIYLMAGTSSSVSDAKMQTFRGTNLMANVYIFNSRLNFCYSAGLFCLCASISPCRTRWHLKFLEKVYKHLASIVGYKLRDELAGPKKEVTKVTIKGRNSIETGFSCPKRKKSPLSSLLSCPVLSE